MQKTSQRGRELIQQFEGLRLTSYRDVAGIWTIGYGHTGPEVVGRMTITKAQATKYLEDDLTRFERGVTRLVGQVDQEYFDALVSLSYNIGLQAFAKSSVLRWHKRGDEAKAAAAFLLWNKARVNGKLTVVAGLARRRAAEASLYREGDFADVSPSRPIAMTALTSKQIEMGVESSLESSLKPEQPGSLPDLATSGRVVRSAIGAPAAGGLAYTTVESVNGAAGQEQAVDAVQGQLQNADAAGAAVDPGVVSAKLEQVKNIAEAHQDLILGIDPKTLVLVLAALLLGIFAHALYSGYTARNGSR